MNTTSSDGSLSIVLWALLVAAIIIGVAFLPTPPSEVPEIEKATTSVPHLVETAEAAEVEVVEEPLVALITGYNTVPEQTDETPCIAASGDDICGRTDVVACPSAYPLGTKAMIDGRTYICLDRTAAKYDGRWDISCDKDMSCPSAVFGWKEVLIVE